MKTAFIDKKQYNTQKDKFIQYPDDDGYPAKFRSLICKYFVGGIRKEKEKQGRKKHPLKNGAFFNQGTNFFHTKAKIVIYVAGNDLALQS